MGSESNRIASLGDATPIGETPLCDGPAKRVGVDEAGRGPLFGRVYAAAVLLHEGFDVTKVKDSKKFTSEKKRAEAAAYIQANSVWSIAYVDENTIDQINILQATLRCMHTAIHGLLDKEKQKDVQLLIDGNCFKPLFRLEECQMIQVPHTCIEKGDALHPCISAASILAKVARDNYVLEMCAQHPDLNKYGLVKNKGYGTKAHRDAIQEHGLSQWHRKSFNRGSA